MYPSSDNHTHLSTFNKGMLSVHENWGDLLKGEDVPTVKVEAHTASGLPAADSVQEALQALSARIAALET